MKKFEAIFYDENKLQKALGMIESLGVNIKDAEVIGGGESLLEQTFDRSYGEVFGSATGFAYSSLAADKNTPSLEAYPMPDALAYVADDLASTTHKHGIVPGDVGSDDKSVSGEVFILRMKMPPEGAENVRAILAKNGAKRFNILN